MLLVFWGKFDLCSLLIQIPFCVVVGWMMGQKMDLNFQLFETATLFITVLVVAFLLQVDRYVD
jgi:Ca2+/H+ antiporter